MLQYTGINRNQRGQYLRQCDLSSFSIRVTLSAEQKSHLNTILVDGKLMHFINLENILRLKSLWSESNHTTPDDTDFALFTDFYEIYVHGHSVYFSRDEYNVQCRSDER